MKALVGKVRTKKVKVELSPTCGIDEIESLYLRIADELILSDPKLIFLIEDKIRNIKAILGFIKNDEIITIAKDIVFIGINENNRKIATTLDHKKGIKNEIVYEAITEKEINEIISNNYYIDSDCFNENILWCNKYQNIAIVGNKKVAFAKVINAQKIIK